MSDTRRWNIYDIERFCPIPFQRLALSPSGDAFLCCKAWLDVPVGNFFKEPLDEIWNSESALEIRRSILEGDFTYCSKDKCPRILSGLVENLSVDSWNPDTIKDRLRLSRRGPQVICLNYDNSCNLFCKSCRSKPFVISKERQSKLFRFQDSLIKSSMFKNVERLVAAGAGEPFFSEVLLNLFGKKIERGEYPHLKITFRTNGTLLTPHKWDHIRNVHYAIDKISISIDAATEATYRVLRRGGNFKKLLDNLKFLRGLKTTTNFELGLNFVVQKGNFREMPQFVNLAKEYECDEVVFTQIFDKKSTCADEHFESSVHRTKHSQFRELRKIVNSPVLNDPIVNLGNLSHLLDGN